MPDLGCWPFDGGVAEKGMRRLGGDTVPRSVAWVRCEPAAEGEAIEHRTVRVGRRPLLSAVGLGGVAKRWGDLAVAA
jgi:hypothetical protein